jgi:hypothetical protein
MLLIIATFGCASKKAGRPSLPETSMKNWPKWMLNPPQDPDHLFAAKTETSLKAQLAEEKAATAARADIAKQLEIKVQSLEKKFDEEVGLGENAELNAYYSNTIKTITSQTLNGSKVIKKDWIREGELFRAFVLMDLPLGEFNSNLVKSVKKNKQLYDRFRASQSFNEMEKDMEKYEQWKKEQGE